MSFLALDPDFRQDDGKKGQTYAAILRFCITSPPFALSEVEGHAPNEGASTALSTNGKGSRAVRTLVTPRARCFDFAQHERGGGAAPFAARVSYAAIFMSCITSAVIDKLRLRASWS